MLKIDSKTEEGRRMLSYLIVDAILNEKSEELRPPYKVKPEAYCKYKQGLVCLAKLKGQGKLDFSYDSIYHPYPNHFVNVRWKERKDSLTEIKGKEAAELLNCFEYLVMDTAAPGELQLSSEIYVSK